MISDYDAINSRKTMIFLATLRDPQATVYAGQDRNLYAESYSNFGLRLEGWDALRNYLLGYLQWDAGCDFTQDLYYKPVGSLLLGRKLHWENEGSTEILASECE
jgi:hypothetical protein